MNLIPLKKHVHNTNISKVSLRYHEINHYQRKIALNFSEKISIYKKRDLTYLLESDLRSGQIG